MFSSWNGIVLALLAAWLTRASSFAPPVAVARVTESSVVVGSPTQLYMAIPLVGRFRKKKEIKQKGPIRVGEKLPEIDVEVLIPESEEKDAKIQSVPQTIQEVLGDSKAVLVGMPGAFTPTCSKEHLPGYMAAVPKFSTLGIDKIAVVTTNDRYVNEKWTEENGVDLRDMSMPLVMLSDGDGDLVMAMGLAEDMGFGVGIRSKRFCMVVENGAVTTLLTDEGMDDCSNTAATSLLRTLDPEGVSAEEESNASAVLGLGLAAIVAAAAAFSGDVFSGGADTPQPAPTSPRPAAQKVQPQPKARPNQSSFNLLNEYMSN